MQKFKTTRNEKKENKKNKRQRSNLLKMTQLSSQLTTKKMATLITLNVQFVIKAFLKTNGRKMDEIHQIFSMDV